MACRGPALAMMVRHGGGRHAGGGRDRLIMLRAARHQRITLQRQHQREQHGKSEAQRLVEPHSLENIPPVGEEYTRTAHRLGGLVVVAPGDIDW